MGQEVKGKATWRLEPGSGHRHRLSCVQGYVGMTGSQEPRMPGRTVIFSVDTRTCGGLLCARLWQGF